MFVGFAFLPQPVTIEWEYKHNEHNALMFICIID
jgi:hypothetical protein